MRVQLDGESGVDAASGVERVVTHQPAGVVVRVIGEAAGVRDALLGSRREEGLALSVAGRPPGEGFLVWLSMGMFAFSLLVIAAPLVNRFVPITGALALAASLIAPWL